MSDHASRIMAELAANPALQDLVRAAQEHPGKFIVTCAENDEQAAIRRMVMEADDSSMEIGPIESDPKLGTARTRRSRRR